jgi:hypothetical protein
MLIRPFRLSSRPGVLSLSQTFGVRSVSFGCAIERSSVCVLSGVVESCAVDERGELAE